MNFKKQKQPQKIKLVSIKGNNIYLASKDKILPSSLSKIFKNIENELILNEKENLRILDKSFSMIKVEKFSKTYSDFLIIYNFEKMSDYLNSEGKLITFGLINIEEKPVNSSNFLIYIFFGFILSLLTTYTRVNLLKNKK